MTMPPFTITFFKNTAALHDDTKQDQLDIPKLIEFVEQHHAPSKDSLKLFKLAAFGDQLCAPRRQHALCQRH
jgi:hypothetical protein